MGRGSTHSRRSTSRSRLAQSLLSRKSQPGLSRLRRQRAGARVRYRSRYHSPYALQPAAAGRTRLLPTAGKSTGVINASPTSTSQGRFINTPLRFCSLFSLLTPAPNFRSLFPLSETIVSATTVLAVQLSASLLNRFELTSPTTFSATRRHHLASCLCRANLVRPPSMDVSDPLRPCGPWRMPRPTGDDTPPPASWLRRLLRPWRFDNLSTLRSSHNSKTVGAPCQPLATGPPLPDFSPMRVFSGNDRGRRQPTCKPHSTNSARIPFYQVDSASIRNVRFWRALALRPFAEFFKSLQTLAKSRQQLRGDRAPPLPTP